MTDGKGFSASFAIDDFQRQCLMEGLDDIGLTLLYEADIAAFEHQGPRPDRLIARNSIYLK